MFKYHSVTEEIQELLRENNIEFKTFEHEAVRTSEEAHVARPDYTLGQGAKAIIIKVKPDTRFVMLVMPADKRFDQKKVKKGLGVKSTRFATEEEVKEITKGVLPGGVPPFGVLFGLETYVDSSLFDNKEIIFNAGDRSFSVAMSSDDYRKVAQIKELDLVVE